MVELGSNGHAPLDYAIRAALVFLIFPPSGARLAPIVFGCEAFPAVAIVALQFILVASLAFIGHCSSLLVDRRSHRSDKAARRSCSHGETGDATGGRDGQRNGQRKG